MSYLFKQVSVMKGGKSVNDEDKASISNQVQMYKTSNHLDQEKKNKTSNN